MDVLTFETCLAVNSETIKQVTSSWYFFIQLSSFSVILKIVVARLICESMKLDITDMLSSL